MNFRVIDGCPVPKSIAPYVYIVLRDAGQTATSIYRGADARAILHAHGKHTQAEVHRMLPHISNPPGRSQHELRSDGYANRGPVGRRLAEWQIGVDSGGNSIQQKNRVTNAGKKNGWEIRHPYSRGVEGHHWTFAVRPRPKGVKMRLRIIRLRATLPRK